MPWAGEGYQRADADSLASYDEVWIGVLPENASVVTVFRRCRLGVSLGGMGGVLWHGISAREVRSACVLSRVPARDWPRLTDGVQLMGRIAARIANEGEQEASKQAARRNRGKR